MRRQDRERNDQEFFDYVLNSATEMSLAFASEGAPYVIPVNFVYENMTIWIHCATSGHKLELLARWPEVGFCAVCDAQTLPERSTTRYCSVCGSGRARFVTDLTERQEALKLLALRYQARCPLPTPVDELARTGVIRINVEVMTGKCSKP